MSRRRNVPVAYREKVSACDVRIEAVLKELSIHRGRDHGAVPPPRRRHRTDQVNALAFDVRSSYETRYRTRVVNNLHRRAKAFGFLLQPLEPKAGAAVS